MGKLVRDKIRDIIIEKGQKPLGYFSSKKEFKRRLAEKLVEEANEFCEDKNEEELADVLEVVDAIYKVYGYSKDAVHDIQEKKRKARGGFNKGYILKSVD